MLVPSRRHRPPEALAALLRRAFLRLAVLASVAVTVSQLGPEPAPRTTTVEDPAADAVEVRTEQIVALHSCSHTGLAGGAIPARAVLRTVDARGRVSVRITSFDRGWAAYTGERPGTLVAVCP